MNADMRLDMPMVQLALVEGGNDNRVGYRCLGHTFEINNQSFRFARSGLDMLAEGYTTGKPLLLNHNRDGIGMGATTLGEVNDEGLFITWYILKNKTLPQGPLGTSEQVIESVDDGAIQDVSMGLAITASECSICGAGYDVNMPFFRICQNGHEQGTDVIVEKNGEKRLERAVQIITAAEAAELSLVYDGADKQAKILSKVAALRRDGMIGDAAYAQFNSQFQSINLGGNPEPPQPTGDPPMSAVQAELDLYKEKLSHKDTEVRALNAELELEKDKVATLTKDNQRVDRYKQDAEFARGLILADLREQYIAHKEGVTDAEADDRVAKAKNVPLEDVFEDAQYFRCRADERFGAGEGRQSQADPGKDPRSGNGIVAPAGSARY